MIRIINYKSGLGNQLFYYLLGQYFITKYPNDKLYGYYLKKNLINHNGLELPHVFEVSTPSESFIGNIIAWLCRKLNGIGVKGLKSTDAVFSEKTYYYDGYWQDKKFFLDNIKKIRFRELPTDEYNIKLSNAIRENISVAVHVRRGDYLTPINQKLFGGICTKDYYNKAIGIVKTKLKDPFFYIFSNDIDWCKENLNIDNCVFVNQNKGNKSWVDMYLMSLCKGVIIANSSFSYWAAILNQSNDKLIIYPYKWNNIKKPDIFPENWLGI